MLQTRKRKREPIPGYRLIEPLGRGGFGEVWKCEAPGGLFKAIKFVVGEQGLLPDASVPAVEELKAIQHIKSLRHPFLLSMERVELIDGELVIVMELADKSLTEVFHEYRTAGATGIPPDELLGYLHEAADVLDLMNLRHGLQHLDIKPANLFLVSNHVKVGDFGLVRSLSDGAAPTERSSPSGGMTALYAAPEMFENAISSSCDQYSLAIVYQELLTGKRPFNGKNLRQLLMQRSTAKPDLRALPESSRAAVARALSKNPQQRFPSCMAFIHALQIKEKAVAPSRSSANAAAKRAPAQVRSMPGASAIVAELIVEARGVSPAAKTEKRAPASSGTGILQGRFPARLVPNNARASFETFRRQWNAQVVGETASSLAFQVALPSRFWQRWLGGAPGLLVEIRWTRPRSGSSTLPEVSVRVRCSDKKSKPDGSLIKELGPLLLESLRTQLEAYPERRTQERLAWPHPVRVTFFLADDRPGETIEGKGKDISLTGMGLYLPRAHAGSQIQLELRTPSRGEPIVLFGHCVRVQRCGDGWFETGVLF